MSRFVSFFVGLCITNVLFCFLGLQVYGDKIEEKIYMKIKSITACVRLLNATHQIGCTSKRKGDVGVVHYISSDEDFEWLLNKGKHGPYVPLFTAEYFTADRFNKLVDAGKVSGALVDNGGPSVMGYSPGNQCPNDRFGLYYDHKDYSCSARGKKAVVWNRNGSEMSYKGYDMPVFALFNNDEIDMLTKCYHDHNKPENGTNPSYPLCAVELQYFMFAAKDTPTCMRKNEAPSFTESQFCDPLGDYNVWGTLFQMTEELNDDDVVLATAKLDSSSFFHDIVPGGDNDASGVIVLLAAAEALGNLKRNAENELAPPDLMKNEKHIMFSFFQGEAWDYIGSSRMVYDMTNGNFPNCRDGKKCGLPQMNVSNIASYLELSQVGLLDDDALWVHSDPLSNKNVGTKVSKMFKMLETFGKSVNMSIRRPPGDSDQPLPPASFQRFLKKSLHIPGLVITDHKTHFTNKFYNSRFDRLNTSFQHRNKLVTQLTNLATTVANSLYELAYNKTNKNIVAMNSTVDNLLTCFLETANCQLFKNISTKADVKVLSAQKTFFPRYVGPFEKPSGTILPSTKMTKLLLSYFTGIRQDNYTSCSDNTEDFSLDIMEYEIMCVNSSVYMTPALSPAFLLKDYASTEYSTWTESRWANEYGLRMFLIADPSQEMVTLLVGIFLTLIAGVVTVFMYTNADKVFTPGGDVLVINDVQ